MRNLLFIASIGILLLSFTGFKPGEKGEGIQFYKGSFDQAREQAASSDKLIFVDAYAVWCGPCKKLAKTTFQDNEVGMFFNENFVNLKVDMEKGEGVDMRTRYQVTGYPTMLLLDSDGEIVARITGYRDSDELLKWAKRFSSGKG